MHTASFENIAVAATQDMLSLLPATQRPIEICRIRIMQIGTADMVAGQEEALRVALIRGHTTAPSGGAAVTPALRDTNQATAGATARRNDTTIAAAGTAVTWADLSFNVQIGLDEIIPPEYRPRVQNANWFNVRLLAAPADSITMSGTIWFRTV